MGKSDIKTNIAIPGLGPWTAVGHREVIKMRYFIGIGPLESDYPTKLLAWDTSFYVGVSLSSLKWGFYNSSSTAEKESSFIEFTLHDIAGQTLADFFEIRSATVMIFLLGPMSDGYPWFKFNWAKYKPVRENCQIEFSPTQGFTYKFSGTPLGRRVGSKELAAHSKIFINGLDIKGNQHNNTFEDYLKEIEDKWNSMLAENPDKAGTALIKFEVQREQGVNSMMLAQTPFLTEKKEADNELKSQGDPVARVQQFEINPGTAIAHVVQQLWQQRFAGKETGAGKNINAGSYIELTFKKYSGGVNSIDVKLQRKDETDKTSSNIPVCIGSDIVCYGWPFRAQLTGIDFKGIMDVLTAAAVNQTKTQATGEVSQQGNAETQKTDAEKERVTSDENSANHMKETLAKVPSSPGLPLGNNGSFDGWHTFGAILNKHRVPGFSVEIEMPYTFAFTPQYFGGWLMDAVDGVATCAIDIRQGVSLTFYWYVTPRCDFMLPVQVVSTTYRITSVTHSIGLNGNTTQVKLSHLTISTT